MQELGTFGAIIKFAITLEEQAKAFYSGPIQSKHPEVTNELLRGLSKRINRLKRIRQELVTEMILEPINGFDGKNYWIVVDDTVKEEELVGHAIWIEKNMNEFYNSSAPKIPMKEVQRAFMRLAKENNQRVNLLEGFK